MRRSWTTHSSQAQESGQDDPSERSEHQLALRFLDTGLITITKVITNHLDRWLNGQELLIGKRSGGQHATVESKPETLAVVIWSKPYLRAKERTR